MNFIMNDSIDLTTASVPYRVDCGKVLYFEVYGRIWDVLYESEEEVLVMSGSVHLNKRETNLSLQKFNANSFQSRLRSRRKEVGQSRMKKF